MKRIFTLFALCAFALVACEEKPTPDQPTPEPPTPTPDPVLTLTSAEVMSFGEEGGDDVIRYTLENEKEGVDLTATSQAEWITDIVVGPAITFHVVANDVEQARTTTIEVKYDTESFAVTIEQEAKEATPEPEPELNIQSPSTFNFDAEGGSDVIYYTITNPKQGVVLSAKADVEWITDITIGQTVGFTVAANESEEERSGKLTLSYDTLTAEFTINQRAKQNNTPSEEYTFDFVATHLNGTYYGTEYSADYNYLIFLSDVGVYGEYSFEYVDSHIYCLDLYSTVKGDYDNPVLPTGVYKVDVSNSCNAGTCSYDYSYYNQFSEDGPVSRMGFESGVINVTENHIEVVLYPYGGGCHHIVYDGPLTLGYRSK